MSRARGGNTSREQLDRALDRLVKDVQAASDAEILEEAAEIFGSADAAAARVQAALTAALNRLGKRRLQQARAGREERERINACPKIARLAISEKRKILERFAGVHIPTRDKLTTMAARNGGPISEGELDGILEDLIEIGAIDEQGNPG